MLWWKRLIDHLRSLRRAKHRNPQRTFELDDSVLRSLNDLAAREQRPPDEVARYLVSRALLEQQTEEDSRQLWRRLTPREQQVVALICLNYTTTQIAARLSISSETVKTHAHHALNKFGAQNRQELRQRMTHWDFTRWDEML